MSLMSKRYTRALETYRAELERELHDREINEGTWNTMTRKERRTFKEIYQIYTDANDMVIKRATKKIREYEKRCA